MHVKPITCRARALQHLSRTLSKADRIRISASRLWKLTKTRGREGSRKSSSLKRSFFETLENQEHGRIVQTNEFMTSMSMTMLPGQAVEEKQEAWEQRRAQACLLSTRHQERWATWMVRWKIITRQRPLHGILLPGNVGLLGSRANPLRPDLL